jgi:exodeoxyribonuclease-3
MRFATWNVNSVKARLPLLLDWLAGTAPDVLCLQETKVPADGFPAAEVGELGYETAAYGQGRWNGVAVLSRVGLTDVRHGFPGEPGYPGPEARAISATCAGIRFVSVYVPNGRTPDDPHYTYKLAWLEALRASAQTWADAGDAVALMGDWNVIPLDTDVYDVADFAGKTHVSPPERAAFEAFGKAGYTELTRQFIPEEHAYTYWDYQQLAFPRNKGLRIDFCWASPALAGRASGAVIDRDERKGKGASDHVPVIVDLTD